MFPDKQKAFPIHKAIGSMGLVNLPTDVLSSKQKHHSFNGGNDFQGCNHSFKLIYIYIHIYISYLPTKLP